MEARVAGEKNHFYAAGASEMSGLGKKSLEWDLNDWRWDGELFLASPLNPGPSNCRNKEMFLGPAGQSNILSSCSEELEFGLLMKGNGETEKRRKISAVEDAEPCDGAGSLALKLAGHDYPIAEADLADWEGKNGKRLKSQGGNRNRPTCQVEGCGTDLSGCKDYHRRHKVCEMHAKASRALVGNVMQRFCQQCSRFHLLQEFDEGKRSCRRRLAGHNKRRRKTHPDAPINGNLIDNQTSTYVLISLLRILSNLHSDSSDQSKDQEFVSHILKNLASFGGSCDARKLSGLLQESQDLQKDQTSAGTSSEADKLDSNGAPVEDASRPLCSTSKTTCVTGGQRTSPGPTDHTAVAVATLDMPSKHVVESSLPGSLHVIPSQRPASYVPADADSAKAEAICSLRQMLPGESDVQRASFKDFDLNNTYIDPQDCCEECDKSPGPANVDASWALIDSLQSSPPQTSGNSGSTSSQSLSNSKGDAQSRTDKIVFKLFGKDPNDAPLALRSQILDWLSHSPTEMESYIRPGCIILTVYLRLTESAWEELSQDLTSNLNRLLCIADDDFWRRGWVYVTVQQRAAFIFNGRLMLATPELPRTPNNYRILCVTPIAVSLSTRVSFTVKGFNLAQSAMRLLCAFEGRYLLQETTQALVRSTDTSEEHEGLQCLTFSCSMPNATGRGFIEVEDSCLSSSFFPFIIAQEDVCSEIRMLEDVINVVAGDQHSHESLKATHIRNQALDFLNDMGWLLRRSHSRSIYEQKNPCTNVFSLTRFRWLMAYAMDREWCAVVKKLLDILFQGTIDVDGLSAVEVAQAEYLLHSAVRKNSKSMVELLLRYKVDPETKGTGPDGLLFRPDMMGTSNITPLHIVATSTGYDGILDALTNDPGLLGIKAWNTAQDSTGFTPKDYASSRGYESYINLVQKKIDKQQGNGHVVLDIPGSITSPAAAASKQLNGPNSGKVAGFEIGKSKRTPTSQPSCKLCSQQLVHQSYLSRSLLYRPAMLSLVGIAAVCVCVALLFKGPPNVLYVRHPFRWESLGCGTM